MTPRSHQGDLQTQGGRFAVLASRFNEFLVAKLIEGAVDALGRAGAAETDIEIFRCPGAFEIPGLARRVAATGAFDGLVCLGVVIRGATPHFDMVVNHAGSGVAALALEGNVAVGFGVLACDTIEQAIERCGGKVGNRGFDAAMAAVEMASLYRTLKR